jgi:hypothetical protein
MIFEIFGWILLDLILGRTEACTLTEQDKQVYSKCEGKLEVREFLSKSKGKIEVRKLF